MRKGRLRGAVVCAVLVCHLHFLVASSAADEKTAPSASAYEAIAVHLREQAEAEIERVKLMVEQGSLPRVRLTEAESHLADAQDEVTLAQTLYGPGRLQDMTPDQEKAMTEAARRRVERQEAIVQSRQGFVESGILARSDFEALEGELAARQRIYDMAQSRVKLLDELRQMVEAERRLESGTNGQSLSSVMTRYEGNGVFHISEMQVISKQFEQRFHRLLPVSALGQTHLHQSMGLDHTGRVDVALNPNGPEGLWLRSLLERQRIPYLAFKSAFAGAATAAHIHIGLGSSRLAVAQR